MVFLSFMMFSRVKYPSFKSLDWRTQRSIPKFILTLFALLLVVIYARWALMVLFVGYLLYGFLRPMLSPRIRREIEEDDEPAAG